MPLGRSLIYIENKRGSKIDPCGTPVHTSYHLENNLALLSIITVFCFRLK